MRSIHTKRLARHLFLPAGLLLAWLLMRVLRRDEGGRKTTEPSPSPAAGGKMLLMGRLLASYFLLEIVPTSRRQVSRYAAGNRHALPRVPSGPDDYRQKVRYRLPFGGEWYVVNGGIDEATSHSWELAAQRYAYDFLIADGSLRRWRPGTKGARPEDYLCYDEPILSPADGLVVEVSDGLSDAPRPGTGWIDAFAEDFRGNFVVIEHAEDEYSFLAHLIPGSIEAKEGERVERGKRIGRCGNSGHSTEPHPHFHVQDRADFFEAAGLPVAFDGVVSDGGELEAEHYPRRGERVR